MCERWSRVPMLLGTVAMLLLAAPLAGQDAPRFVRRGTSDKITVRAGTATTPSLVPPRPFDARGEASRATINVTYTGFTPAAQAAFQFAVDIWASQLTSPVPIQIEATFTNLDPGVLGAAGPTDLVSCTSSCGALIPLTWYPLALASKLAGFDTVPGASDIEATFSSSFTWYFGTDGLAPPGTFDFVSVVLHELGHGLGFVGLMQYSAGVGGWGFGTGRPAIYDRFTVNGSLQSLINTSLFPNPSVALGSQLTSNNLFFNGPSTRAANFGGPAFLYAPSPWSPGSSYAHLNEATFGVGNPNSLMTPILNSAEAIHDPGPITRGLFTDMGWTVGACSYSLSSTSFSTGPASTTGFVSVFAGSGCQWTAVSNSSALSITGGGSGSGDGTVTFAVAANVVVNTPTPLRVPTLTIAGMAFTVSQSGCTYDRTSASASYGPGAGSGGVNVTAPAPCTWTAMTNDSFLAVTGGSSGSGDGTVTFVVASNVVQNTPTPLRVGTLTVAGLTFTVNQGGCTYSRSPAGASFGPSAASGMVAITAPGPCTWTAVANDGFLGVTGSAAGSGSGTVGYTVTSNIGAINVTTPTRIGSLTVAGLGFVVSQSGCAFEIAPIATTFGTSGGIGQVVVFAPAGCSWNVTNIPVWASTTSGGSGSGPGGWDFSVSNSAGLTRSQTISIAGQSFTLRQLASVWTTLVPGRRTTFTLANNADSRLMALETVAGRSYCVEDGAGPVAQDGTNPTITARRADNSTDISTTSGRSLCFIAPATETTFLNVTQSNTTARSHRVALIETTLWANWFFVGSDYSSFTLLRNTSSGDVHVKLTWRNELGTIVGSENLTVQAGGLVFRDARVATVGAFGGSVEIGHDGDAQALVGSQTTLSVATGLSFDTVMMQRQGQW